MNKILLSLLCLPFLATSFPYVVEEDMQRDISLRSSMLLELQEIKLVVRVDGEEREMPVAERSQRLRSEARLAFSDTISKLKDDQPHRIRRAFTEIWREESQELEQEGQDKLESSRTGASPFADKTVTLAMDEAGEWSASIAEQEDFEQALLKKLSANFGFRSFLPAQGEAELGDTWDVPLAAFGEFRDPAGQLSFAFEKESGFPGYDDQFMENLQGTIKAEFVRLDEAEGLAVVALVCKLSSHMQDGMQLTIRDAEGDVARRTEVKLELEGELAWDQRGGGLRSIEVAGSLNNIVRITQTIRPSDGPFEERVSIQTMRLAGSMTQVLGMQ